MKRRSPGKRINGAQRPPLPPAPPAKRVITQRKGELALP